MSAAASLAREGDGRAEWLRVYDRMVAILRKNHRHVEALLADRSRLEALLRVQHDFWVARHGLLRGRLNETRRAEACVRRCGEVKLELLLGVKYRKLRRYQIYAENQDEDLEDFKTCAVALAEENAKLKLKLKEVESSAELSENTAEHEHSGRDWRAEIRELTRAYKNLSSEKDKEVSALAAQKDFVWHQFKTMEKEYGLLLKKKTIEASQATEAAQRLQQKVEELQAAAQKKDDDIGRLQVEANGAKKLILVLEDKIQKLHSLASEEDDEIQKVKGGRLQASQKRKQDNSGTHRKSRSEGHSQRSKSKNNARRKMVGEDQPETSQKRQCASSLSNGLALQRCSSRMQLKPAGLPALQQVLFHSSFKVPKLKTPPAPPPPPPL
ncbi:hypothetical protein ACQ4PT_046074 [Festuca glaucescens]